MIWRLAVFLVILLGCAASQLTLAAPAPEPRFRLPARADGWENDNNLIDTLFQNFNGNESDNGGSKKKETIGPLPAPVSAPASVASSTDTQVRARAGRETVVFLTGDRVVVRVPASLTDDLELSILVIPAPAGSPPPGPVIGSLVFKVSAQAPGGEPMAKLPTEANLSARYTDAELGARDEGRLVLAWLDPGDGRWKAAPKPAADPRNNFMSATIQDLGVFAVYQAP